MLNVCSCIVACSSSTIICLKRMEEGETRGFALHVVGGTLTVRPSPQKHKFLCDCFCVDMEAEAALASA